MPNFGIPELTARRHFAGQRTRHRHRFGQRRRHRRRFRRQHRRRPCTHRRRRQRSRALYTPEPEFSEEARKAKVAGNVLVYLQVDTNGRPVNVRVIRGIGLGLDEKALEAVKQYKFKPAMENGKPVRVEMNVEGQLPDLLAANKIPSGKWKIKAEKW